MISPSSRVSPASQILGTVFRTETFRSGRRIISPPAALGPREVLTCRRPFAGASASARCRQVVPRHTTPLNPQLIKGARHPDLGERHLHVEHSEDSKQLP